MEGGDHWPGAAPASLDIDDIRRLMPLEERHYRFQCGGLGHEAVPWIGFPMRALLERVEPLAKARFVRLTTCSFSGGQESAAGGSIRGRGTEGFMHGRGYA